MRTFVIYAVVFMAGALFGADRLIQLIHALTVILQRVIGG